MCNLDAQIAWLSALKPATAVEEIAMVLNAGADIDELLAVGALTATRFLNNQARNLLGFVSHAMIGCEDARRLAANQPEATRQLLTLQALYQVVLDLHDPCFAPSTLVPFWPTRETTVAENVRQLRSDVRFGEYMRADHRLAALNQDLPRDELIDLLLEIGLEGMVSDDHTLITPVLCLGMIELVGWERGFDMLRWGLRYSASFPRDFAPYDRAVALRQTYQLEQGAPITELQPERIGSLRQTLLAAAPHERPELVARALADDRASPQTVLAAISLAACDMYLMTRPVPHDDYDAVSREVAPIHIGTTINTLRAGLTAMKPATQVLATIMGGSLLERGPSVLNTEFAFVPFEANSPYPFADDLERLRGLSPDELLTTLYTALNDRDPNTATAAVATYAAQNEPAAPVIAILTAVASTDNGTLLHNYKHLHSCVEEFYACHLPDRWNYLIAAARWISWYAGKWTEAYERARGEALHEAA